MTRSRPGRTALLALAGFLTISLPLGGCSMTDDPTAPDPEAQSRSHGRQIEAELPAVIRAAGLDHVGALAEDSCLGHADPEQASRKTRWSGGSGINGAGQDEAGEVAGGVRDYATAHGWTAQEGTGPHGDRLFAATKDDLTLTVAYRTGAGDPELSVTMSSPCLEMPAGHTMSRSGLDPMYGSPDPMYPNDDRSQFTNGEPRPLPGPSGG